MAQDTNSNLIFLDNKSFVIPQEYYKEVVEELAMSGVIWSSGGRIDSRTPLNVDRYLKNDGSIRLFINVYSSDRRCEAMFSQASYELEPYTDIRLEEALNILGYRIIDDIPDMQVMNDVLI